MLKVNEMFGPTIQGEGKSVGKEVVFLRLSMCNLHCIWCDTPYTWNWFGTIFAHPQKYDRAKEECSMTTQDVLTSLRNLAERMDNKALVVSGGEPLLQQAGLVEVLKHLKLRYLKSDSWWIEVETNGTIAPTNQMIALVDQFNVSPKLTNSQNPDRLRERPEVMKALAALPSSTFKFVISSVLDVNEVEKMVKTYNIPRHRVFLMPEGRTREELGKTRKMTLELSRCLGVNFSDRLHILRFGAKRAV